MGKQLSWREYERSNDDVKKADVLKIPVNRIYVREGYNIRDLNKPSTQAKIQGIKESYKAGRYVDPIAVTLVDGEVYIVNGHCRFTAVQLANAELDVPIQELMVVPFKGNDTDQTIHQINGNEGERCTPLEISVGVKRLIGQGHSHAFVAKELNCSPSWVDRLVALANLPQAVKNMVAKDEISVDVALDQYKEHGSDAPKVLKDLKEKTKGKVTTKHVAKTKPLTMEQVVFQLAKSLVAALPEQLADEAIPDKAIELLAQLQQLLNDKRAK